MCEWCNVSTCCSTVTHRMYCSLPALLSFTPPCLQEGLCGCHARQEDPVPQEGADWKLIGTTWWGKPCKQLTVCIPSLLPSPTSAKVAAARKRWVWHISLYFLVLLTQHYQDSGWPIRLLENIILQCMSISIAGFSAQNGGICSCFSSSSWYGCFQSPCCKLVDLILHQGIQWW